MSGAGPQIDDLEAVDVDQAVVGDLERGDHREGQESERVKGRLERAAQRPGGSREGPALGHHLVGRRSLTVSLSDLASMGAEPRWCVATCCADPRVFSEDLLAIQQGICDVAAESGCAVIGGKLWIYGGGNPFSASRTISRPFQKRSSAKF